MVANRSSAAECVPRLLGEEQTLVARVRAGDEAAFEAMFLEYYRPLYAFVNGYVRSRALAEELVQELLMNVWLHRERWQVRGSVRTYLFGAARNRALNCTRNQRIAARGTARAAQEATRPGMGQEPPPIDERATWGEFGAALSRAIERLPARQREAFTLRWQAGLSHAEIAAAMGIALKTVEFNLSRACRTLREELAEYL